MMEPVAWAWRNAPDDEFVATLNEPQFAWEKQPLVRLSDAEARIEELEATIEQMKADHACEVADMATRFRAVNVERLSEQLGADIFALRDRAEAAEALMKEQEAKIERLLLFGGRMANACYNVGQKSRPSHMDMVDLLFAQAEWDKASRAARAIHHKIGVKDE